MGIILIKAFYGADWIVKAAWSLDYMFTFNVT